MWPTKHAADCMLPEAFVPKGQIAASSQDEGTSPPREVLVSSERPLAFPDVIRPDGTTWLTG